MPAPWPWATTTRKGRCSAAELTCRRRQLRDPLGLLISGSRLPCQSGDSSRLWTPRPGGRSRGRQGPDIGCPPGGSVSRRVCRSSRPASPCSTRPRWCVERDPARSPPAERICHRQAARTYPQWAMCTSTLVRGESSRDGSTASAIIRTWDQQAVTQNPDSDPRSTRTLPASEDLASMRSESIVHRRRREGSNESGMQGTLGS
jgi:hypothetical protein